VVGNSAGVGYMYESSASGETRPMICKDCV